jgi:hypothetical protein
MAGYSPLCLLLLCWWHCYSSVCNTSAAAAAAAAIVAAAVLQIGWDNAKRLLLLADKYDAPLIIGE